MSDQNPISRSQDLPKLAIYGKDTGDRNAPVVKVSVSGASYVGFILFLNAASEIEKENAYFSAPQVDVITFLKTVAEGVKSEAWGEYVLERDSKFKDNNGNEIASHAELIFDVKEDGVAIKVVQVGKNTCSIGLRLTRGTTFTTPSPEMNAKINLVKAVSWIEEAIVMIPTASLLLERNTIRTRGGDSDASKGNNF